MKAAYDEIMGMPAIIVDKDDKRHEITVAGRICCWVTFVGESRVYYWDEFMKEPLDMHGIEFNDIKEFANRPAFKEEARQWRDELLAQNEESF